MRPSTFAILCSSVIILTACSGGGRDASLEENPLYMSERATNRIEYVTSMQIRANERKEPITDPRTLRVIDETLASARSDRDRAEDAMEEGKKGSFYPIDDGFAQGQVLLLDTTLFFGYSFDSANAPGMRVLLATHVSPHTLEEMQSESTIDLGPLSVSVGPQQMELPYALSDEEWNHYRTVVLFSEPLQKIVALAQIRGAVR